MNSLNAFASLHNRAATDPDTRPAKPAWREAGVEYWRVERVARYLDISKKRVYQLVQEKRLQAIRLGPRQMRILANSVESYVAELLAAAEMEAE